MTKDLKEEKGITLITLVITILIMLILAGITVTSGLESVEMTKQTSMITQLEMIQEKVNTIYEKGKLNQEDIEYYYSLGQDISTLDEQKRKELLKDIPQEEYRYFSQEGLKQLELDNISQDVIINFKTRDVISVNGILIDKIIYYRLMDIPGYQEQIIKHIDKNNQEPTFDVEVNQLTNSWQIILKDISYNSNVYGGNVSYKLHDDTEWIMVGSKNDFEIKSARII